MPTTKAQYLALMKHAIHAESPATGVVLETVLNQAGQKLFDAQPWPWLITGPVDVAFTQGSNEAALPADFQQVVSCVVTDNILQRVRWVSADVVNALRNTRTVVTSLIYNVCAQQRIPQATPGVEPAPILMLDRDATADGTPTFTLLYSRRWKALTDDNAIPDMPSSMEWALTCLCRAMAWGLENDQEHPDMARYQREIEEQWKKWRTVQPHLGPTRGGAGDRVRRGITSADLARFRL